MIRRGDLFDADVPGIGVHPVVIASRDRAIPVLTSVVAVLVTNKIRGHPAEVPLDKEHGLEHESVANCDSIHTVPKRSLLHHRGRLGPGDFPRLDDALRVALQLD